MASVYPLKGRIYAADRQIGPTTGALRLEALFPNPGNALRPGEFARLRVKFDLKHDTLLVPQRAVSELQGSYQVDVVAEDNKIHVQPVRVGERSGNLWMIEEGLRAGQRVVVEGIQKVREGMVVNTDELHCGACRQGRDRKLAVCRSSSSTGRSSPW